MAQKKKSQEKVKHSRLREDDAAENEAPVKAKSVKARKVPNPKNVGGTGGTKNVMSKTVGKKRGARNVVSSGEAKSNSSAKSNSGAKNVASERKAKNAVGKSVSNGATGKQGKIQIPDASEQSGAGAMKRQAQDPFEVAKRKMEGSVPAIVDAMVKRAKQGSCPHAKTLLEMTGAKHMFEEADRQDGGESWAKLVLERLDEAESATEREFVGV